MMTNGVMATQQILTLLMGIRVPLGQCARLVQW